MERLFIPKLQSFKTHLKEKKKKTCKTHKQSHYPGVTALLGNSRSLLETNGIFPQEFS